MTAPGGERRSTRRRLSLVRPGEYLPTGALPVGAGLVVAGVTAYAFLIVSARSLGPARYASLSALWSLVLIAGPGIFFPLEQEVARAVAARRARGDGGGPVVKRAAALGGALVVVVGLATLVASRPLLDHVFNDEPLLLVALAVALPGYLAQHLARGVLAGGACFATYGSLLGVEGALRLASVGVLAVVGTASPGPFGLVVGFAPLAAVPVARRVAVDVRRPGPPAPLGELSQALGYLLAGSILSQVLVNVGPVAVKVLAGPAQEAAAGRFLASLVLARVPLFFFGAVLVSLLPKLSRLAAAGHMQEFETALSRLTLLVLAVAATGTVAAATVGPAAVRFLFGADFSLGWTDLAVLAAASGAYMLALTLSQGLIALLGHRQSALGWLAGVASFAAVSAVGSDVLVRIERGLLVGALAAALALGALLRRRLRAGEPPGDEPPTTLQAAQWEP